MHWSKTNDQQLRVYPKSNYLLSEWSPITKKKGKALKDSDSLKIINSVSRGHLNLIVYIYNIIIIQIILLFIYTS